MRVSGVGAAALRSGRTRLRSRATKPTSMGDAVLYGLCALACLLTIATIVEIATRNTCWPTSAANSARWALQKRINAT